jgi:hypothetical protein
MTIPNGNLGHSMVSADETADDRPASDFNLASVECPACEFAAAKFVFSKNGYCHSQCGKCGICNFSRARHYCSCLGDTDSSFIANTATKRQLTIEYSSGRCKVNI